MVADEEEQPENINNQNLPKGEQLLCSKYLVSSDQANKEAQAVRQSVQGKHSCFNYVHYFLPPFRKWRSHDEKAL